MADKSASSWALSYHSQPAIIKINALVIETSTCTFCRLRAFFVSPFCFLCLSDVECAVGFLVGLSDAPGGRGLKGYFLRPLDSCASDRDVGDLGGIDMKRIFDPDRRRCKTKHDSVTLYYQQIG